MQIDFVNYQSRIVSFSVLQMPKLAIETLNIALASVAQLLQIPPHWKITDSIHVQGTYPGYKFNPQGTQEATNQCYALTFNVSLSLSLPDYLSKIK